MARLLLTISWRRWGERQKMIARDSHPFLSLHREMNRLFEKANYHMVERSYGTFLRSLRLPYSVDTDKIRADFANGVLTVTLPKYKDKEISRKISVQCGRPPGSPLPSGHAPPRQIERPPDSDPNK